MVRRKLKLLLIALATVAGIVIVAFAGLAWVIAPHSPDLTPAQAKRIIEATPEFNQSRSVVAVSETKRGDDSMAGSPIPQNSLLRQVTRPNRLRQRPNSDSGTGGGIFGELLTESART